MPRSLIELLKDYAGLPEYLGEPVPSVNSPSLFGDYPVNIAAVKGSIDDLEILLNSGANINQLGEDGFTPLHYAVLCGHLETVRFLVEAGASIKMRNDDDDTPLEIAEALGEHGILAVLLGS